MAKAIWTMLGDSCTGRPCTSCRESAEKRNLFSIRKRWLQGWEGIMFETGNLLDLQFQQVSCFVLSDLQLVLDADITQTIPRRSKLKVFHLVIACSWQLPCPGQDNGSGCMNPSLGKHQWQLWCQLRTVQVYDSIWRRVNQHCQTILRGILFNFCLIKGSLAGKLPRYGVLRSPEITTTNHHHHHKSPPPQITNTTATTPQITATDESPPQITTTTNVPCFFKFHFWRKQSHGKCFFFGGSLARSASESCCCKGVLAWKVKCLGCKRFLV